MAEEEVYEQEETYEEEGDGLGEEYNGEEGAEDAAAGAPMEGLETIESMKKKLKEMEDEAARLKAMQAAGPSDVAATTSQQAADQTSKEEIDARSIYVGNVDYACTPEEVQQHFQSCGTVNRVTILADKFGSPKGYAYVEFLEVDAVQNACLLDNSELHGRNIKVTQKRTNVPGLRATRGRGGRRGGFAPYPARGGYHAPPGRGRGFHPYSPYGYPPRGRGRGRGFYTPY